MDYLDKKILSIELSMELGKMAADIAEADLRIAIGMAEILKNEIKSAHLIIENMSTYDYSPPVVNDEPMPFIVL